MAKIGRLTIPDDAEFPGPGMAYYRNKTNGFTVLVCHDTADPAKRSMSWANEVRRGYTDERTYDQEHNLSFESWAGKPVFSCFDKTRHVAVGRLQYQPRILMQRWWDIGIHACIWAQVRDGQMFLFDSRQTIGAFGPRELKYRPWEIDASGLGVFIERCIGISEQTYGDALSWRDVVDPSAFATDAKHETTAARIFQDHGLRPIAGDTQDMVTRINDIEDWLTFQPGMVIDPNAAIIVDGLAGGFTFLKEGTSEKPDWQSGFGHCLASLSYGAGKNRAFHTRRQKDTIITSDLDPARHDLDLRPTRRRRSGHWMGY